MGYVKTWDKHGNVTIFGDDFEAIEKEERKKELKELRDQQEGLQEGSYQPKSGE